MVSVSNPRKISKMRWSEGHKNFSQNPEIDFDSFEIIDSIKDPDCPHFSWEEVYKLCCVDTQYDGGENEKEIVKCLHYGHETTIWVFERLEGCPECGSIEFENVDFEDWLIGKEVIEWK